MIIHTSIHVSDLRIHLVIIDILIITDVRTIHIAYCLLPIASIACLYGTVQYVQYVRIVRYVQYVKVCAVCTVRTVQCVQYVQIVRYVQYV